MSTNDYRLGKPKSKKITLADIDEKYWPQWYVEMRKDEKLIIDESVAAQALEAALNIKRDEKNRKLEAKRYAEEQRIMEQREKQHKAESERLEKLGRTRPERQLTMLLTGKRNTYAYCHLMETAEFFGHSRNCPIKTGEDIEPALSLLAKEYRMGKIIRLDDGRYHFRLTSLEVCHYFVVTS